MAALVIVRRSKSGRAKRRFTSPPQWATKRSRGAILGSDASKLGLSQVVRSASARAISASTAGVSDRAPARRQR